jgi:hemerythrin superfamily protein
MKATDIIARDHRAAEALFDTFKSAAPDDQKEIEKDLFNALSLHELMEDRFFYPALKEHLDDNEMVKELAHEQTTLKLRTIATQVKEAVAGPDEESVEKVMERVLAHAKKEETDLFTLAEDILGEEKLEQLGREMEPHSAVAAAEKQKES